MSQSPEDVLDVMLHVVAIISDLQNNSRLVQEVICECERQEFGKTLKKQISSHHTFLR